MNASTGATVDLVLVNPDYASVRQTTHIQLQQYPPLGLAYLAAYYRGQGGRVSIIDAHALRLGVSGTIDRLTEIRPPWVGIYVTSFSLPVVKELAEGIRGQLDCKIVVGGPHVTHFPTAVETLQADYGIAGDGEHSLSALLAGQPPESIAGLIYREQRCLKTNPPEVIRDLDALPCPARDLLPEDLYYSPFRSGRITTMITSRGCPCDCIFCALPSKGRYFQRSAENVLAEMVGLREHGASYVEIQDDLFTGNRRKTKELCEAMLAADLGLEWGCETRADMVDYDTLEVMRRAGCTNIKYGVESGVERIRRDVIGKRITDAEIRQAVADSKRVGMETTAYFVFGFPGETADDMRATVEFALSLKCHYAEFHLAVPIPGSRLFDVATETGQLSADTWIGAEKHDAAQPVFVPKGVDLATMESLQRKAYRRFYVNPRGMLRIAAATRRPSDFAAKAKAGLRVMRSMLFGG